MTFICTSPLAKKIIPVLNSYRVITPFWEGEFVEENFTIYFVGKSPTDESMDQIREFCVGCRGKMKEKYWVIFPQGFKKSSENFGIISTAYGKHMNAYSFEEACELMEKYDGAYFEEIHYIGGARYAGDWYSSPEYSENQEITREELFDIWKNKPEIDLDKE